MSREEVGSKMVGVINQLAAAVQNAGMYPATHPNIISRIREAYDLLSALLKKKKEISILRIGKNLIVDNKPLGVTGTYGAAFVRVLKKNEISRVTFVSGLTLTMLEDLIQSLASSDATTIRSSSNIRLGRLELDRRTRGKVGESPLMDSPGGDMLEIFEPGAESPSGHVRDIYRNIIDTNQVDYDMVNSTVLQLISNLHEDKDMWQLLSQVKTTDEYTFIHTANVGIVTMALAEFLGFKGPTIQEIGVAAVLHDVGKLTLPDYIISKPTALTTEERLLMETHPVKGALCLMEMKSTRALPTLVALEHHMKYDGGGYPKARSGHEVNVVSQIIAIADVFDALRTLRSYRNPLPMEQVLETIRNESGSSFNPYLVEQFLNMINPSLPASN